MKRSEMVLKIAQLLKPLKRFEGVSLESIIQEYEKQLIRDADVILTTLEQAGMQPPNITLDELIPDSGLKADAKHYYACWEPESETDSKDQRAFWDDDNRGSGAV